MIKHARVVSGEDLESSTTLVVPVIFDDNEALIADAIPASLAGHVLPRVLEGAWCAARGLNATPGSALNWSLLDGPTLLLVSLGSSYNNPESFRWAGASAVQRAVGDRVTFFLPTDGIERPDVAAQALIEGALLASYDYKKPD